ncbi:uncharacterized protein DUF4168 [Nitrosomonas nitrosa]|uniref:DUF4168 domain-containing protein n=1 Tax=Nitrosomonas nitrosa TaxID=52442 RepID=A0A1I4RG79_9PROT|nr:DUF4168 domain-containing protein [Nitrosomonas nitrosa]PTQ92027.1 uncharacterized protein DUF4168 [Nitrosomonas nitrosa]CAE6499090.1 conserved exported hypothetical protein [Nitrosomonas nitrosa]SFM51056.1 protein of unknown function [Nitrosomonas nitrosa]
MKTLMVSIVIFVASMGLISGTNAQQSYGQEGAMPPAQQNNYGADGAMPPAQHPNPANFSEADLQKFAAAQKEVEVIRRNYTTRLENAGNPDKALELQQEASEVMVDAVKKQGLEIDTYNNIARAMGSNPDLRRKLEAMQ